MNKKEREKDQAQIRSLFCEKYGWETHERKSVNNLLAILLFTQGKQVKEMHGDVAYYVSSHEDYMVLVEYTDGSALCVEYSGEEPGYSEYTPGSPARVEYWMCTPKKGAA